MTQKLDLGWRNGGLGRALSNFCAYSFVLDGVQCGSMEGWLQSLKFDVQEEQEAVAALVGYQAYKIGQAGNNWRDTQTLWWKGKAYPRLSKPYHALVERAYDACFDASPQFQKSLVETGTMALTHVIGSHDPTMSVLTEWEYIYNVYRLRSKAQQVLWGM